MTYATPGVYVEEISSLPPSVVGVSTSVPLFIGYTEKLPDEKNEHGQPEVVRIGSMMEFENKFGGPFLPKENDVEVGEKKNNDGGLKSLNTNDYDKNTILIKKRFYLYYAVDMFFRNSNGGVCFVLTLGKYDDYDEGENAYLNSSNGKSPVDRLKDIDDATLVVLPDAVKLGKNDLGNTQTRFLQECQKLKDKFAILDVKNGDQPLAPSNEGPVATFRNTVGNRALDYGGAYYPYLVTNYDFEPRYDMLNIPEDFRDESGKLNVGKLGSTEEEKAALEEFNTALNSRNSITIAFEEDVFSDDEKALKRVRKKGKAGLDELLNKKKEKIQSAVDSDRDVKTPLTDYLKILENSIRTFKDLDEKSSLSKDISDFIANAKGNEKLLTALKTWIEVQSKLHENIDSVFEKLDYFENYNKEKADKPLENIDTEDSSVSVINLLEKMKPYEQDILNAFDNLWMEIDTIYRKKEQKLFEEHPLFKMIGEEYKKQMQTLPPSGAMAGIYGYTDKQVGVWAAPANYSLNHVIRPAVKINDDEQAGLNEHTTGKSINAIRAFTNRGTLVYGCRTLDANSNEWRYIPVRLLFNYIEASMKKSLQPFVFQPNSHDTWVTIKSMADSFLNGLWEAGALFGDKPEKAFYTAIGLGQTMTPEDVYNGRLIMDIGIAPNRPSEFIILRFTHKMIES